MKTISKKITAFVCALCLASSVCQSFENDHDVLAVTSISSFAYGNDSADINIISKSDDTLTSNGFYISGTVNKAGKIKLEVNGNTTASSDVQAGGSFDFNGTLKRGRNDVNIYFTDTSGKTTRKTFNYVYLKEYDAVVDRSGKADSSGCKVYTTLQSAVDSANAGDVIFVKNGDYNERVVVKKEGISIIGQDRLKTRVYYSIASKDVNGMSERNCMKIESSATGFTLENITVENTYPYTNGSNEQADALCVICDKAVFANVALVGYQDTLLAHASSSKIARQYFYKCYITGNVDFIYGDGRSYFEDCDIVGRYTQYKKDGCFTAPRTASSNAYGYVFNNCRFTAEKGIGDGAYRLARPWGADASATFLNCYMSECVKSEGYGDMSGNSYKNARFFEYHSFGAGAVVNDSRRQLSDSQANDCNIKNVFSKGTNDNYDVISVMNSMYGGNIQDTQDTQPPVTSTDNTQNNDNNKATMQIYCSPSASSNGSGTYDDPTSFENALSKLEDGGVIWLKGGVYNFDKTIVITEAMSGKSGAYRTVASVPGESAVFDFSALSVSGSNRGVVLDASWWHWYGVTVQNAGDNGMLLSGDNNIVEMCIFSGNQDTGLQLSRYNSAYNSISEWPTNNYIKNCTSMNNCDDKTMENADGFAAKLTCGEQNVFDGCMAYNNSDDGWDLYAKTETGPIGVVTIKNCVSFRNGYTEDGRGYGDCDGNGFKLGGAGVGTAHTVENSIAFENLHHGFTDNNNPLFALLSGCTSYKNAVGGSKANFQLDRCSAGTFKNLLSYTGGNSCNNDKFNGTISNSVIYNSNAYWKIDSSTAVSNSKAGSQTTAPSDSDFVSVSAPKMGSDFHKLWRNSDGSINTQGFLEVKSSALSGKGADMSKFAQQKATPLPMYENGGNNDNNDTDTTTTSATTTAPVVPEMKYGDINADNVVDLTDLTYLSLYLLSDKTFDDAQLERADVWYDSSVDIADLAYLKQYISKDDVVLGKH